MCVCVGMCMNVSEGAQKVQGVWSPWNKSYRRLWAACGFWESHPGHQVFLTVEASLQCSWMFLSCLSHLSSPDIEYLNQLKEFPDLCWGNGLVCEVLVSANIRTYVQSPEPMYTKARHSSGTCNFRTGEVETGRSLSVNRSMESFKSMRDKWCSNWWQKSSDPQAKANSCVPRPLPASSYRLLSQEWQPQSTGHHCRLLIPLPTTSPTAPSAHSSSQIPLGPSFPMSPLILLSFILLLSTA